MNNPIDTLFTGSDCPTHDQLLGYVKGQLSDEEMHQIEMHLIDCEMCSDEIDGLTEMKDPKQLPDILEELEQRMAASQSKRFRLNTRMILAAAAVIVLLAGTVYLFRYVVWQTPETLVSEQITPLEDSSPPSKVQKEVEKKVSIKRPKKTEIPTEKKEEPVQFSAPAIAGVSDGATTSDEIEAEIVEEPVVVEEKLAIVSDTTTTKGMGGVADVSPKTKARSSQAVSSKISTPSSTMNVAMVYFNLEEYRSALKLFQNIVADDSLNYKAIYHLAFCYHELKRDKKSLKELAKILSDSTNIYFQEAQLLNEKISGH